MIEIKFIEPVAGNNKGRTWGPSTVHQRERVNLPELKQSQKLPSFFKSAPNLDKPRTLQSHHDLGKSEEMLNRGHSDDYSSFGCFPMFSRADSKNALKIKKYSLDNEVPHNRSNNNNNNNLSLTSRGLKGSFSFDEESTNNNVEVTDNHNKNGKKRLQKSWDQLAESMSTLFDEQCRLNSKSSDDIYSSDWVSSQFNDQSDILGNSSTDMGEYYIRDDHSSKSSRLDDSISSETGLESEFFKYAAPRYSGRSRAGSGRKTSVTFNVDDSTNEIHNSDPNSENNVREKFPLPTLHYIDIPQDNRDVEESSSTTIHKKKKSSKQKIQSSLSSIFKPKSKNKRVKYTDSFRKNRESNSDMNEKLLQYDSYDTVYGGNHNTINKRS